MKTITTLEVELNTDDQDDADAVMTLLNITLANFGRTLKAHSPKVGEITFHTEVEE